MAQKKLNQQFFKKARRVPKKKLDLSFRTEHDKVFSDINCMDCANCCKTTSPIFKNQDIKRLSTLFKMKINKFIETYLRLDDDGDYVVKSSPCPFLMEDNSCFVYEERPMACREYPHTNRKNMNGILKLTEKNTEICPAVAKIVENLRVKL